MVQAPPSQPPLHQADPNPYSQRFPHVNGHPGAHPVRFAHPGAHTVRFAHPVRFTHPNGLTHTDGYGHPAAARVSTGLTGRRGMR